MAQYKPVKTLTFTTVSYPQAVKAANKISKRQNRNVHEVVQEILLDEANKKYTKSEKVSQEKKVKIGNFEKENNHDPRRNQRPGH